MIKVAKLVIINGDGNYLMMYRTDHPRFGNDADLPGGTVEHGESPIVAMIREVDEEAGIMVTESQVRQIYEGTDYSEHGTQYSLFVAKLDVNPTVAMSWEHSAYEWITRTDFLEKSKNANDTYMHMVHDEVAALSL